MTVATTITEATGDVHTGNAVRVFWIPGCSSCVKVKEFLNKLGVPFQSVNVLADPNAEAELQAMGAMSVPIVSRGKDFVFAQSLDDVSKFLGRDIKFDRLPPADLMNRWFYFCDIALTLIANIPQQHLNKRSVAERDRTLHGLSHHIFQVPRAFLENVENGEVNFDRYFDEPPPDDVIDSVAVIQFGRIITAPLHTYYDVLSDKSFSWTVNTFYGVQPSHQVLERFTWHMAQHIRQLQAVLDRYNVPLLIRIDETKYKDLPMPEGLWE